MPPGVAIDGSGVLADLAVRATLLLAALVCALAVLRGAAAAHRHLALLAALAGLLLLPALGRVARWELPVLPAGMAAVAPPAPAEPPIPVAAVAGAEAAESLPAPLETRPAAPPPTAFAWVLLVWGAGTVALLARWAWSLVGLHVFTARCRPTRNLDLLEQVDHLAWRMGIQTVVRCVESDSGSGAPMTWGWRRPIIALPPGGERWPLERLRAVLLHELAHVERRDWLWQQAAAVACALYWFHPGVWWVAARLRAESEAACDDRVLEAGMPAPDYARSLLEVVQTMHGKQTLPAVTMARGSRLERRIRAILGHRRRGMLTRGAGLAAALIAGAVVVPIAATHVTARAAEPETATYTAPAPPAAIELDAPAAPQDPEDPRVEVRPADPPAPPTAGVPEPPRPPLTEREKRLLELERKARALTKRPAPPVPPVPPVPPGPPLGPDRARLHDLIREKIARAHEELARVRARLEAGPQGSERDFKLPPGLKEEGLRRHLDSLHKEIERHFNDPAVREKIERHLKDPAVRENIERHFNDPALRKELDSAREELKRAFSHEDLRKHLDMAREHLKGFSEDDVRKHLDIARKQLDRALAERDGALRERMKLKLKEKEFDGKLKERERRDREDLKKLHRKSETEALEAQVAALRAQQEALRRQIERLEEQLRLRK